MASRYWTAATCACNWKSVIGPLFAGVTRASCLISDWAARYASRLPMYIGSREEYRDESPDFRNNKLVCLHNAGSATDFHIRRNLRTATNEPWGSGETKTERLHPPRPSERYDSLWNLWYPLSQEYAWDGGYRKIDEKAIILDLMDKGKKRNF